MWEQVQETVSFIKSKINFTPEYGVILGSGLGSFTEEIKVEYTLPYNEIPNFPVSTVQGHKGALVFGTIGTKKVVAMQGRFHFYEGYSMTEVTFPVRVMKFLGVEKLDIEVHEGIYLGLQGPTFETLAEYKMVKILGADCVGMSTVPEVIVARHMDLETFGISVITDMGNEESIGTISHDEVLEAAKGAEPKVRSLIRELILNY